MNKIVMICLLIVGNLFANEATVEDVHVTKHNGSFSFAVRILHKDSGWEHYVNRYEVLNKQGKILATRVLFHPHEYEQPFTRSLSGVKIEGLTTVYVRAHDSVDGYSKRVEVRLP